LPFENTSKYYYFIREFTVDLLSLAYSLFCESFDQTFSKVCGFLGQSPESMTAVIEIPRRWKKFLFCFFSLR